MEVAALRIAQRRIRLATSMAYAHGIAVLHVVRLSGHVDMPALTLIPEISVLNDK
jgi:hypothetical protein